MKFIYSVLALSMLNACDIPIQIEPIKPYASWPNQAWAEHAERQVVELGLNQLTLSDAKDFCPNGLTTRNWVHLFAAMIKYESNFNPKSEYKESFGPISTGLFQVSLSSSQQARYSCGFKVQSDIHDPLRNITCGAKIIKALSLEDGRLAGKVSGKWKGAARYFSVLRVDTKSKKWLKQWCE